MKQVLITLFKLAIVVAAITFVLSKIDVEQLQVVLKTLDIEMVCYAFAALLVAQSFSAFRLQYYYATIDYYFSRHYSHALYFIGAFFNIFLPGGVGGDGYLVMKLKKLHQIPIGSSVRLLLSTRCNGLYVLIVSALCLAVFVSAFQEMTLVRLGLLGMVLVVTVCYLLGVRILFRETPEVAIRAVPYSIGVQVFGMVAAYFLFLGMAVDQHIILEFMVLFLISSVVSMLPISIGGIGLREVTFLTGAPLIGMNNEVGVAIAFLFFIMQAVTTLIGIYYFVRMPEPKLKHRGLIKGDE